MQQRPEDIADNSPLSRQAMSAVTEQLDRAAGEKPGATGAAKEKAAEIGHKAQDTADEGIAKAASGMVTAADKLRERAEQSDGVAAQAGTKVADSMEKTAGYLREKDTTAMLDDLESYIREHPLQALAGAIVGGFVIGRVIR